MIYYTIKREEMFQATQEKLAGLEEGLDESRKAFNEKMEADQEELLANVQADIDHLKTPIQEIDLQMIPGEGIVDGELVQPPGFVMRMKGAGGKVQSWKGEIGKSKVGFFVRTILSVYSLNFLINQTSDY